MTHLDATRGAASAARSAPGATAEEARGAADEHIHKDMYVHRPAPALEPMLAWLRGAAVTDTGDVRSWVNPAHPGYPYPEAAGLLLTLLASVEDRPSPARESIAARLADALSPAGAVGRDGVDYAFDSAMALHGLLAHARAGGRPHAAACDRLYDFIADCVERRAATGPGAPASSRWSTSWGCHLLKLVIALRAHGGRGRARGPEALVGALRSTLTPLERDGRFAIHSGDERSYVHATCYALEGLLALTRGASSSEPDAALRAPLRAGVDWLASIQAPDGSLPAWHNGQEVWGPAPTDIVAQSVRLWAAVDRERYAAPIARGLARLAALQTPAGGLRYLPDSQDINTWCTIFAVQATLWSRPGAALELLA